MASVSSFTTGIQKTIIQVVKAIRPIEAARQEVKIVVVEGRDRLGIRTKEDENEEVHLNAGQRKAKPRSVVEDRKSVVLD